MVDVVPFRRCGGKTTLGCRCENPPTPDLFSHVLFTVADVLILVTIRRCGGSGVLAARFRFVSWPIQSPPHVRTLYICGDGFLGILYCLVWLELSPSSLRCRPCEPCGPLRLYLHPGVSWKLNRSRPSATHHCQVGSLSPYLVFFKVFVW